jgi:hypothetical protein
MHRDVFEQLLEVLRARDEVRLAVELEQNADLAAGVNIREAFFAADAMPRLRSTTNASSISPLASCRAFRQSPIGAPDFSRSSFTSLASIFTASVVDIILPSIQIDQ